jgi:hypothetical protein
MVDVAVQIYCEDIHNMEGPQHKKDQMKGDFKQYKVTNLDAFV